MTPQWTTNQEKVINFEGDNLLVGASAGSGKTAVLVEHVISKLRQGKLSMDRILLVTFTEAAAREMKERIRSSLHQEREESFNVQRMMEQEALVDQAAITTIHSFCLRVLREHFTTIDVDPTFRVGDDSEMKMLKKDVAESFIEECYQQEEHREVFLRLVDSFSPDRNDDGIVELLLNAYEISAGVLDVESWWRNNQAQYQEQGIAKFQQVLQQEVALEYEKMLGYLEEVESLIGMEVKGAELVEADAKVLQQIGECEVENLAELFQNTPPKFKNFPRKIMGDVTIAKALRQRYKDWVKEKKEQFNRPFAEQVAMMEDMGVLVEELGRLLYLFDERYAKEKEKRHVIDFRDMERMALQILLKKEGDRFVPSDVAKSYQEQFDLIVIDEYQDSNDLQEAILQSICRQEEGKRNCMMVGDVKQSIYGFRGANPRLFLGKEKKYKEQINGQYIFLEKNFRSRLEILEATNFIFKEVMGKEVGGIEYDASAFLQCGRDDTKVISAQHRSELVVVDGSGLSAEKGLMKEAEVVAKKINEMYNTFPVPTKEGTRPALYKDMVILLRSMGACDVFKEVLEKEGIPCYVQTKEGYFDTFEVALALNYLRIIDNMRQDIPLAGVLLSPLEAFTAEELAKIKLFSREVSLYEALCSYEQEGIEPYLRQKVAGFLEKMEVFRKKSRYTSTPEMLLLIFEETGLDLFVQAMPKADQRKANVDMLLEKARTFENSSYHGISHFVRYIEYLRKYAIDEGEVMTEDEQSNLVRIMTIHKSKGLEFPVVFVSSLGKLVNSSDAKESVLIDPRLGVGMNYVDTEQEIELKTLYRQWMEGQLKMDALGEELRILYVALTRAREKLIMTGVSNRDKEALLEKLQSEVGRQRQEKISGDQLMQMTSPSFLKMCLGALLPYEEQWQEESFPVQVNFETGDGEKWQQEESAEHSDLVEMSSQEKEQGKEALKEQIKEKIMFTYPFAKEIYAKRKMTVSEIKTQQMAEKNKVEKNEAFFETPQVRHANSNKEGAVRGIAYHKVMERWPFDRETVLLSQWQEFFEEEKEKGRIEEEQLQWIKWEKVAAFARTELYSRMCRANQVGCLYKEQPFSYLDENGIVIQGMVDSYFEEEDGLVLLDYKTDVVSQQEVLLERYTSQLQCYAKALEMATEKPVKEIAIYSFALEKVIEVN